MYQTFNLGSEVRLFEGQQTYKFIKMKEKLEPKKEEKKEAKMNPFARKAVEKKEASSGKKVTLKTRVARKATDAKLKSGSKK